jgi:8-oxo-dGTP pyrophosphatase MutT (NUDIX family)
LKSIQEALSEYEPKPMDVAREYAVLIPLWKGKTEWEILYETRSDLISQPGEISFPGGRVEPGETPQEAAIRETCEELGIEQSDITILGSIDYLVTRGFVLYPFVAIIEATAEFQSNPDEVAELFGVSIRSLKAQDPEVYWIEEARRLPQDFPHHYIPGGKSYPWRKGKGRILFYPREEGMIWGMTAQITHHFVENFCKEYE